MKLSILIPSVLFATTVSAVPVTNLNGTVETPNSDLGRYQRVVTDASMLPSKSDVTLVAVASTNYTDSVGAGLREDVDGISAYTGVLETQKRNKRDLSVGWTWETDDPNCPQTLVDALNRSDAPVPNLIMKGATGEWGLGEVVTNGVFGWINFVATKSPDAKEIRFGFTDEREGPVAKYFATARRITSLATLAEVASATNNIRNVDGAARPLPKYLHALEYDATYPEDVAALRGALAGRFGCSARRSGGILERNYDLHLDETAEFVVRMSAVGSRFASLGIANVETNLTEQFVTSGKPSRWYKVLPSIMLDGINENGVVCEVNMTQGDWWWRKSGEIHCLEAVRWALDNGTSAGMVASNLAEKVYIPQGMGNFHWMVADAAETWIVENCEALKMTNNVAVLTNFTFPNEGGGEGYERYSSLMSGATITSQWWTAAYDRNTRPIRVSDIGENYEAVWTAWESATKEEHRAQEGWWQTLHTSIYDITNRVLRVAVQETDDWYVFALSTGGGKVKSVNGMTGEVVLGAADVGAIKASDSTFDDCVAGWDGGVFKFSFGDEFGRITIDYDNLKVYSPGSGLSRLYFPIQSGTLALKTDIPVSYTWDSITGKPSTFPPSDHNQAWSTITSKPTTLAGYGIANAYTKTESDERYVPVTRKVNGRDLSHDVVIEELMSTNANVGIDAERNVMKIIRESTWNDDFGGVYVQVNPNKWYDSEERFTIIWNEASRWFEWWGADESRFIDFSDETTYGADTITIDSITFHRNYTGGTTRQVVDKLMTYNEHKTNNVFNTEVVASSRGALLALSLDDEPSIQIRRENTGAIQTMYTFPSTSGTFALSSDIPTSFPWASVTGKPTTLAGYGIANAYTKAETDAKDTAVATSATNYTDAAIAAIPPVELPSKWALANVTNAQGQAVGASDVGAIPSSFPMRGDGEWVRVLKNEDDPGQGDLYIRSYMTRDLTGLGIGFSGDIMPLAFLADVPTVYDWAKSPTKPTYDFRELTIHPTTLAGYGITDAVANDADYANVKAKALNSAQYHEYGYPFLGRQDLMVKDAMVVGTTNYAQRANHTEYCDGTIQNEAMDCYLYLPYGKSGDIAVEDPFEISRLMSIAETDAAAKAATCAALCAATADKPHFEIIDGEIHIVTITERSSNDE